MFFCIYGMPTNIWTNMYVNIYPYTLKESFFISRIKILQGTVLNPKHRRKKKKKKRIISLIQTMLVYEESKLITFPLVCATRGKVLEQNVALGIQWVTWGGGRTSKIMLIPYILDVTKWIQAYFAEKNYLRGNKWEAMSWPINYVLYLTHRFLSYQTFIIAVSIYYINLYISW